MIHIPKPKYGSKRYLSPRIGIALREEGFFGNLLVYFAIAVLVLSMSLPGRALAANIVVNSLADTQANDGACTLREAIINANNNNRSGSTDCTAGSGADTITFSVSGTITLGSTLPNIASSDGLTIDGGNKITISGNNSVQVLIVNNGVSITLQNLNVADGFTSMANGAGIDNEGTLIINNCTITGNFTQAFAGAIYNEGTLTITQSTVSSNGSSASAGAILNEGTLTIATSTFSGNSAVVSSGAIFNAARIFNVNIKPILTITNSTFSDNSSLDGAILSRGIMTVINSTFSDNVGLFSSCISNEGEGTLTITNSSFSDNDGAIVGCIGSGPTLTITNSTFSGNNGEPGIAAVIHAATAILRNTVLANNLLSNCLGAITDGGYNIDDGTTCGFSTANHSQSNTNPLLDPAGLKDNGGPTETIALCTAAGTPAGCSGASPAIDVIPEATNGCGTTITTDQRGVTRPQDGNSDGIAACDIGAFEVIGNIIIGGCNTGVLDQLLGNGLDISGQINECAATAKNHGQFVSCVSHLTNSLMKTGIITGNQKGAIQSCAGSTNIP